MFPLFNSYYYSEDAALVPVPEPLGIIFNEDQLQGLSKDGFASGSYDQTGSPTVTYTPGSNIRFTTASDHFSDAIVYKDFTTDLESWKIKRRFQVKDVNSVGCFISLYDYRDNNPIFQFLAVTLPAIVGRLDFWTIGSQPAYKSDVGQFPCAADDWLLLTLEKNKGNLTGTVFNETQNVTGSLSQDYELNYPFVDVIVPYQLKVGFGVWTGDFNFGDMEYSSTVKKNIDYCILSDSKGIYFAGNYSNSLKELLAALNPTKIFEYIGGPNQKIKNFNDNISQILELNANTYVCYAGSNDIRFDGEGSAESNLLQLKNSIEGAGKRFVFVQSTIEGVISQSDFNTYAGTIIDPEDTVNTSSITLIDLTADLIHLLATTEPVLAGLVNAKL